MKKLLLWCITLRILICAWMILCNHLVTDYDSSDAVLSGTNSTTLDTFARWDGVYFTDISQKGYEYEHFHAFFPLYPLTIRAVSTVVPDLGLNIRQKNILIGVIISNTCIILSIVALYLLTEQLFPHSKSHSNYKNIVCLLFAANPASVFYSSVYTESIYSTFVLWGMYFYVRSASYLSKDFHKSVATEITYGLLCALTFSLATATRGNGIILCGFFIFHFIKTMSFKLVLPKVLFMLLQCTITISTYVLFQYYSYQKYCTVGENQNLVPIITKNASHYSLDIINSQVTDYLQSHHPWCNDRIPHLYANQGFLRYWTTKQIPNFLLAAPMFILSYTGSISYLIGVLRKYNVLQLLTLTKTTATAIQDTKLFVFVCYWLFLTLYCTFFMHVQVATRFLSHCPTLYWFVAGLLEKGGLKSGLVQFYFVLYTMLGSLLFSNFYPWT
ncbi:GPI mannosyltransferase [Acrasis kona]|uniref:GPI mannosyltransferase 2 n=1 Tax=Acrasis kona TaxID=1008807 RepID=A0AAW2ZG96_9EUKA